MLRAAAATTLHFTFLTFLHHVPGAAAVALFHHFKPVRMMMHKMMMFHPADACCNEPDEKDESYGDEEPGDTSKEFALDVFFEFCEQQGACKDGQQRNS